MSGAAVAPWWLRGSAWLAALAVGCLALLAPALWNGFALVFFDTGGYVGSVLEWRLVPGRSLFYGLFLWLTSFGWLTFWGPILVQSLLVLWILHLMLRCHRLPSGPLPLAVLCTTLALVTGVSWYAGQLMPDILVSLTVLALWLLGCRWLQLARGERAGLAVLALFGMLAHMSCLALAMGLALVTVILRLVAANRGWAMEVRVLPAVAVVLAGLLLMPTLHRVLVGQGGMTPGGPVWVFGRLVQDGLARRWLDEHCPAANVRLCALRERLPATADEFLWAETSPFRDLGGWEGGAEPELRRLSRQVVTAYPAAFAWHSLRFTGEQLVRVATGEDLDEHHAATRGVFSGLLAGTAPAYNAARQQQGGLGAQVFVPLNRVHVSVALLATLALALIAIAGLRAHRSAEGLLALFVLAALLGNSFICGALSNPHDRYQSRLVWIAVLVVLMAAAHRIRSLRGMGPLPD